MSATQKKAVLSVTHKQTFVNFIYFNFLCNFFLEKVNFFFTNVFVSEYKRTVSENTYLLMLLIKYVNEKSSFTLWPNIVSTEINCNFLYVIFWDQYKNETKFSNSIRYIWTKIIKIGLLHNGHLCYSKDWNVTPMTLLHKKKNIFIYLKELLHISTNITSLCIHKPIVQWLWFASNICNKISFVSPKTLWKHHWHHPVASILNHYMYLFSKFQYFLNIVKLTKWKFLKSQLKNNCHFLQVFSHKYNLLHKRRNLLHEGRHFVSVPNI